MTVTSNSHIKRKVFFVTLLLLILGTALFLRVGVVSGLTDPRHFVSILAASYLIAWGGYALISRVSRDEIRSQFVLMTVSLGIALTLAELPAWTKLIDYRETFSLSMLFAEPWEQPGYVPDRELLALPGPDRTVKMGWGRGNLGEMVCLPTEEGKTVTLKYDKNGFRNDQDIASAEVVVLGDSYVEAMMTPSAEILTTRLAELQGKPVVNLGQSGFGPQQEYIVLQRYGVPLHPRTIIWVFYEGNDLDDAYRYEERVSLLGSIWGSLNSTWERSFTRSLLIASLGLVRGCTPDQRVARNYGIALDENGQERKMYFSDGLRVASLTPQELSGLVKTGEAIKAAYELAEREGARFVVAFAPTKFRVYHDIAKFGGESPAASWLLNDLPDRLRGVVAEISREIQYLDLTPVLKDAARANQLVFLLDDTHWGVAGHRVVAEALDKALRNESRVYFAGNPAQDKVAENLKIDTSKDAIMVRNRDGTIRYWSDGARRMYGWETKKALGEVSHRLLKTEFPVPLDTIEAELLAKGFWEGGLIHQRVDGSKVSVKSRWELQLDIDSKDQSVTVVEINRAASS